MAPLPQMQIMQEPVEKPFSKPRVRGPSFWVKQRGPTVEMNTWRRYFSAGRTRPPNSANIKLNYTYWYTYFQVY